MLLLDDGGKDLVPGEIVSDVFFNCLLDLVYDGCEHSLPTPSDIIEVTFLYREAISSSVPNTCCCKSLDPLGDFPIFG